MSTLTMGGPPTSLPAHVHTGRLSLTSGVGTLSLCSSRAQLLPLALSLEYLGENKSLDFIPLDKCQVSSPEAHCLLPHYYGGHKCTFFFFFTLSISVLETFVGNVSI